MPDDGYEYLIGLKDELTPKLGPPRDALGRFTKALGDSGVAAKRAEASYGSFFGKMGGIYAVQAERGAEAIDKVAKAAHRGHDASHRMASGVSYAVRGFDDLTRGGKYAA